MERENKKIGLEGPKPRNKSSSFSESWLPKK